MIKTKKQMYIIIASFFLIILLGTTTYAFFNYTRTGTANVIRTGQINFNSEQGTAINLTNLFPIDVSEGISNDATKVGTVTINITGDTTYGEGIEYLVSAVNVTNTVGSKSLPISIDVSVASNTENSPATTLGTVSNDYYNDRGGTTSYYSVLANDVISNNDQLVVGYIAPGQTGVDGNIVIRAYIDASEIAISDTYPNGTVRNVITTNYSSSDCETVLTGVTNASTYCATAADLQDAIDNEDLTDAQIALLVNAGIVEEYTDGTSSEWVGTRTVFTTEEWNSLQSSGISFQIKVEANEGIWVNEPVAPGKLATCPNCVFAYSYNAGYFYTTDNTVSETPTVLGSSDYYEDYRVLLSNVGSSTNRFVGFVLDDITGEIEKAYACGFSEGTDPICILGTDSSKYSEGISTLENNGFTCTIIDVNETECTKNDMPYQFKFYNSNNVYVYLTDSYGYLAIWDNGTINVYDD